MQPLARRLPRAAFAALGLLVLAASPRAQGSSVVSREVSYFAVPPEPIGNRSVVSREVSYFAIPPEPGGSRTVVSREVSYQTSGADLVVASILSSGPNQTALTATITWTVTNQGTEPAVGTWSDRLYRSPDAILGNGNDVLIVSKPRPDDLVGGASYSNTSPITWPASAGTHYLIVRTDADAQVLEVGHENNNVRAEPITITYSALPDLTVQFGTPPAGTLLSGSNLSVGWSVTNSGPIATSNAWIDSVYLTTNGSGALPLDAVTLASAENLYGLGVGQGYPRNASVILPSDFVGTRYIAVRTDSSASVLEQSESNNIVYAGPLTIALEPQPDLVPVDIDAGFATTVFAGQALTVTWKDRNNGNGITDVTAWSDRVYLSENSNPASITGDFLLGSTSTPTGFLAPGQDRPRMLTGIIPTNVSGTRWVKVYADAGLQVSEFGAETNNVAVMANSITVTNAGTPDFQPTAVSLAASGPLQRGQSYPVTWSVTSPDPSWEQGFSWRDSIYLSTDNVLDFGSDVLVQTTSQSAAKVGTVWIGLQYTKTTSITVPTSLAVGTWYALVAVDSQQEVYEFNGEGNNVRSTVALAVGADSPDLATSVPIVASNLPAGQPFAFSFVVSNVGSAPSPTASWSDGVYFSSDVNLQPGTDPHIGTVQHNGGIGVGGSYTVTGTAVIPPASAGAWFLILRADADNAVFEGGSETDNSVVVPITVLPPGANLVASSLSTPRQVQAGTFMPVTWTVENDGTLPTYQTYWVDRVHLSTDPIRDAGDVLLGSKTHSGRIQGGQSYTDTAAYEVPFGLSGAWYVLVTTDDSDVEPETSATDNVRATRMVIDVGAGVPSDLTITGADVSGATTAGQPIAVSWTVMNTGPGPASGPWNDAVYLSADPTFEVLGDRYLAAAQFTGVLAPGESRLVQANFTVPLDVSGPQHLAIVADSSSDIDSESSEANNVFVTASPVTVVIPNACNLVPTEVLVPATGLVGSTISVSWSTANQNGATASGAWSYDLFLSADGVLDPSDREIATVASTVGSIPVGANRTQSATVALPGVPPGSYRVIVLADSRRNLAETSESDNLLASAASVALDVLEILPGQVSTIAMPEGSARYWRITAAADLTLRVRLEHDTASAWTELYLHEGAIPAPGIADVSFQFPGASTQTLVFPLTTGLPVYVLARTTYGVGRMNQDADLFVDIVPFEASAVLPARVGTGVVTVSILGSQLNLLNSAQLVPSSGPAISAMEIAIVDAAKALVAFDLSSAALGTYDLVVASSSGGVDTLPAAVVVEPVSPLAARVGLNVSPSVRKGSAGTMLARLENVGNVNVQRATLVFGRRTGPGFSMDSAALGLANLASDGATESLALFVDDLGPGQSEEVELDLFVDITFPGDRMTFGLAGRPLSDADSEVFTLDVASELLRESVLADPTSNAGLLQRAADAGSWRASVLSNLVVPTTHIHLPSTFPGTGGGLLTQIGLAAAFGLPAIDQVSPSAIATAEGRLSCLLFTGAGFDCAQLAPTSTGLELSSAAVTALDGVPISSTLVSGATPFSTDPNDKSGPTGTGTQNMVSSGSSMEYRVRFENIPAASSPAAFVLVEDELEPTLDVSTFRLSRLVLGDNVFHFPPNSITFQGQFDLSATLGVILQVTAGIDVEQRKAFWSLQSRDPASGLPVTDGIRGILPPNDASGRGQGYVVFSVFPDTDTSFLVTGQGVRNSARIRFDANGSLGTNEASHTFDADAPGSTLTMGSFLGPIAGSVQLQWTGQDPPGGAGVGTYTVYCSIDDAPYVPILADTTLTSFSYPTEFGHDYRIYVLATDLTGNVEPVPSVPDVMFETPPDCNQNGIADPTDIANGQADTYGPTACSPDGTLDSCQPEPDCDSDGTPNRCELAGGAVDTNGDMVPDECQNPTFPVVCAGDGTFAACPCGNTGSIQHGCANSLYASGALLVGSGVPSVGSDTVSLTATNVSNTVVTFIQGTVIPGGGSGVVFGDGVRCVAGTIHRIGAVLAVGGSASYPSVGQLPVSIRGFVPVGGLVTRYYTVWYRNAAGFCSSATFNWTNAVSASWVP